MSTQKFPTALVIGKFYPPHAGHKFLIEQAAKNSDKLVVLVQASRFESVSLEDRKAWLTAEFADQPNIEVLGIPNDCPEDYHSDEIWKAQIENMRQALKAHGIEKIDAVYSSEHYGQRLARGFRAVSVEVDTLRATHRISGTMCRNDLQQNWHSIMQQARRGLAVRVIVVGAESTGTTTLSEELREHYRQQFPQLQDVVEYGRYFTYEKFEQLQRTNPQARIEDMVWTAADFGAIAARQTEMEQEAADAAPLVIADTDALATTLWERYYLGENSFGSFGALEHLPVRDLYLVTDHEGVKFDDDGWREGEHRRPAMTEWFKETLTEAGHSWILVTGSRERRMATATSVIDQIIARRQRFELPGWSAQKPLPELPIAKRVKRSEEVADVREAVKEPAA